MRGEWEGIWGGKGLELDGGDYTLAAAGSNDSSRLGGCPCPQNGEGISTGKDL